MPTRFTGSHEKAATNRESAFDRKLQQFRITGEIPSTSGKQKELKKKLTQDYEYQSMDSKAMGSHRIGELERLAFIDPLTGVLNQRTLLGNLSDEVKRAHRYNQTLGVMVLEVDEWERIEAEAPNYALENLIRGVAQLLQKNIREVDLLGRVDGGKFMFICPETSSEQICVMAERVRNLFASSRVATLGFNISLTVSLGVATFPLNGESPMDVLSAATDALSLAQQSGGNFTAEPINTKFAESNLLAFDAAPTERVDFSPVNEEKERLALLGAIANDTIELTSPAVVTPPSAVQQK